jgi:hypothetical protein
MSIGFSLVVDECRTWFGLSLRRKPEGVVGVKALRVPFHFPVLKS